VKVASPQRPFVKPPLCRTSCACLACQRERTVSTEPEHSLWLVPFRRIVSIDAVDGSGRVVEFPFGELSVLRVDLTANTPSEAYGIFMQRNYGENTAADR
jgi:hypothetical protein